jgi:hypothetical protein
MRELGVAEQRYRAILAVIGEGRTITEVASEWRGAGSGAHLAGPRCLMLG